MSALGRLLARATGQAPAGLTPRLPSRFEAAVGGLRAGFEVVSQEIAAPPSQPAERPESAAAWTREDDAPERPADPETRARPAPNNDRIRPDQPRQPSRVATRVPPPPQPLLPETDLAAVVDPHDPPQGVRAPPPADSQSTRAASPDIPAATPPRVAITLGPPPEPLLPPASPPPEPAPHEAPARLTHRASFTARVPRSAAPEPPEITVHIGRLHVVTDPRGAAAPAPRPRRQAESLSDYLHGKGDGS